MGLKLNILLLVVAACIPHIYSRLSLLYTIETTNDPARLSTPRGWITEKGNYEIKYANKLRNCEDLVVDEKAGYVVLGCDEGRDVWNTVMGVFGKTTPPNGQLYLYDYSRSQPSLESIRLLNTPSGYSFHPLGLSLHLATNTLLAVNHGTSGSTVDQFHFSRLGNSATFVKSISSPYLRAPNAVVQISNTEVLVTNDHFFTPRRSPWLNKVETYLGLPLGGVTYLNLKSGEAQQIARMPYANGLAVLNSTTIAVASSSSAKVFLYEMDKTTTPPTLAYNLSLLDMLNSLPWPSCDAKAPSYVAQWTRGKGLEDVYVGTEIYSSSGVAIDAKRGVSVISGLYGKGLLIWNKEQK
ncbi:hypothetical protein KCU78_g3239, partial [Aureobasidium melanogenum]